MPKEDAIPERLRELVKLRREAIALGERLAAFVEGLSAGMEAMTYLPGLAGRGEPSPPYSRSQDRTEPSVGEDPIVCNYEFEHNSESYCDLYVGHLADGLMHFSYRPRTFIPKRKAITKEEAIEMGVPKAHTTTQGWSKA